MKPLWTETPEFISKAYATLDQLERRLQGAQFGGHVFWADLRDAMADIRDEGGDFRFFRVQGLARTAENLLENLRRLQLQPQPRVLGVLFNLSEGLRQNLQHIQSFGVEISLDIPHDRMAKNPPPGLGENPAPFQSLRWPQKTLLFRTPDDGRMAMPFDNVLRLESFPVAGETGNESGNGSWMPILDVCHLLPERRFIFRRPPVKLPQGQTRQKIVCATPQGEIGLVVDAVLDIFQAKLEVQFPASRTCVTGSMELQDRITEILDIPAILSRGRAVPPKPVSNGLPGERIAS